MGSKGGKGDTSQVFPTTSKQKDHVREIRPALHKTVLHRGACLDNAVEGSLHTSLFLVTGLLKRMLSVQQLIKDDAHRPAVCLFLIHVLFIEEYLCGPYDHRLASVEPQDITQR